MSILLVVIGAITLVLGALAIGFGIPVNEFSFGNTLIMAGTTAAVGGLIVIGLGAVVSHLQRLADVTALRAPPRPNRTAETFEVGHTPATGRIPFPPKPQSEPALTEVPPVEPPLSAAAAASGAALAEELAAEVEAPTLPNPDIPPVETPEEAPPALRPFAAEPPPAFAAMPRAAETGEPASATVPQPGLKRAGAGELAPEPLPSWLAGAPPAPEPPAWQSAPAAEPPRKAQEANFEAVWPASEGRPVSSPTAEEHQPAATAPAAPEVQSEAIASASERRTAAVLKSGVVDGMAYTLYVDGSIEAELPQGTLRFASINDLREHLEKTS